MSEENRIENFLTERNNHIELTDNRMIETLESKTVVITENTDGFDFYDLLAKALQCINLGDVIINIDRTMEYVVQIPAKYVEAVKAGEYLINENSKTGVMWPTLYKRLENGKREFVAQLPIKKEELLRGNPFQSIAQSYHNMYIQQLVRELAVSLERAYKVVERIEEGQNADRIGKLEAGRRQILYSLGMQEEDRKLDLANGRSLLLEAKEQLFKVFKARVEQFKPIPKSEFKRLQLLLKNAKYLREQDAEYHLIQDYYSAYLQATQLAAASYAICGYMIQTEQVFQDAEEEMRRIDFSSLKTIGFIHKNAKDMLYDHAVEYISTEKKIYLKETKPNVFFDEYDYFDLITTGEKIMEIQNNG